MRIFAGVPRGGASNKYGAGKTSYFLALWVDTRYLENGTRDATQAYILLMTNRKLHNAYALSIGTKVDDLG